MGITNIVTNLLPFQSNDNKTLKQFLFKLLEHVGLYIACVSLTNEITDKKLLHFYTTQYSSMLDRVRRAEMSIQNVLRAQQSFDRRTDRLTQMHFDYLRQLHTEIAGIKSSINLEHIDDAPLDNGSIVRR
jgi:hypothetical protein